MSFDVGVSSSSSINVYADMKRLQDYGMIKVFHMCWSSDFFHVGEIRRPPLPNGTHVALALFTMLAVAPICRPIDEQDRAIKIMVAIV